MQGVDKLKLTSNRMKGFGKFNGARLKSARIYREMTIKELAEKLDVSKQSISQYENGLIDPKFEVLLKMISTLGFPKNYFYEEEKTEIKQGNTYFRASSKMSKKEEYMHREKAKLIGNIYNYLNGYIEFPSLNLPDIEESLSIEEKAYKLREYWGLGEEPIKDILYIMEKNGIIMSSMYTNSKVVDAFTQPLIIDGKKKYVVVLGNDKFSATRRQFSAAHELAHIILHEDFLEIDNMTREEVRQIEAEAHEFASAFLLPKIAFSKEVMLYPTNLDYYVELKKKWRTSISAMIVRANRLRIIPQSTYQFLIKKISKDGWRTKEPLDDILIMNQPTVLVRAVDILLDNNIITEEELIKELSETEISLNPEEVETLLGLDNGKLKPKKTESKIIEMPLR